MKTKSRKYWQSEDLPRLKRLYRKHTLVECCKELGYGISLLHRIVRENKITHTKKFQKALNNRVIRNLIVGGKKYRFTKGIKVWNAGMKGLRIAGSEKGWFKKGQKSINELHNGAIRFRLEKTGHNGKKRLMKFIRIKKSRWIYLKNYIWEKHHGKVPKGMLVAFKNPKNTMDCSLQNLCLITKEESGRRTQETPEWLAQTLSHPKGVKRGYYDRELAKEILEHHPELIRLKRQELKLRRKINGSSK